MLFGLNFHSLKNTQFDAVTSFALVVSVVVHLLLIFAVSFVDSDEQAAPTQDVVRVHSSEADPKTDADFLSSANQSGQGSEAERLETKIEQQPVESLESAVEETNQIEQRTSAQQYVQRYLRTTMSYKKQDQNESEEQGQDSGESTAESSASLAAQVARLESKIASRNQLLAKASKVKTLTSAMDSKASPEAAYSLDFIERVEKLGNKHLPQITQDRELTGEIRLLVVIEKTGQVKKIQLLKSSSPSPILARYAKETVRYSAPFDPFPPELDLEEVRIIRTWRFAKRLEVDDSE